MKLENWVRVRLNESQMLIYTAEAEARGIPISTYLRDRLASADVTREELTGIRAAMIDMGEAMDELRDQVAERLAAPGQDREATGEPGAIEIETLLLLRALSTSQNRQMVTGEIERQGLEPFQIPRATDKEPLSAVDRLNQKHPLGSDRPRTPVESR